MIERMRHLRFAVILGLGSLVVGLGCSSAGGGGGGDSGSGNSSNAGTGGSLPGVGGGGGIVTGSGGSGGISTGSGGQGGDCQSQEVHFDPKITTVFVLVDRSSSMTEAMAWAPLRQGTLQVIQELQGDIRFGFGAYTGAIGGTCPLYDTVAANLNNHDAIAALYNSLEPPTQPKGETPTMLGLAAAQQALTAATEPEGEKYILLVTDGEPDYCADGNPLCPADAVVYHLQELYTQGIGTFVMGIQAVSSPISAGSLQAFANAGVGQPVATLDPSRNIYQECFNGGDPNAAGWKTEFAAAGRTTDQTLGIYSPTGGTAEVFRPDDQSNTTSLAEKIRAVVSSVSKSCIFDIESGIRINLANTQLLGQSNITIEGMPVAMDAVNGWTMNSETQLEFHGAACELWRQDSSMNLYFGFPCESVIE